MSYRLVFLQHGMVAPKAAFDLVLYLEQKGITLTIDGTDVLVHGDDFQRQDIEALGRMKPFVLLLLQYIADDRHLHNSTIPAPEMGPIVVRKVS